jgi:hypothetical protein
LENEAKRAEKEAERNARLVTAQGVQG